MSDAPGAPGIHPRWTSSAKVGVGTSLSAMSRVWFTLSHGILNEVYYPRVDMACTRDMGLMVTDGDGFFSEEKRDTVQTVEVLEDGVPAYKLLNRCKQGRYLIDKRVATDPKRDVLLQRIHFHTLDAPAEPYRLFTLLSPHLVNGGSHNTAWIDDYKGMPMLFAEGDGSALALASSRPWVARSAGYAGFSDGWQDVSRHGRMKWSFTRAAAGNVALTGEIDLDESGIVVLALGFGRNAYEAAFRARSSLDDGFDAAVAGYTTAWRAWQKPLQPLDVPGLPAGTRNLYRVSTSVLRTHESPSFPGGLIASLSIPWGFNKGDDDLGGYHLVWPRDLVETAGGLLACGAHADARRVLDYLRATQEGDGHWPQNSWLDGTPYWVGVQMDECAFPILLADMCHRAGTLSDDDLAAYWPMVEKAARYVLATGPCTGQDRWEEDGGFSPFTLAVEIAALLAAAGMADRYGTPGMAEVLRATADCWNDEIEWWTYATDTELARQLGVDGYYVRIAAPETAGAASPTSGFVPIKNRPVDDTCQAASAIVSPDALALVRFGLRAADDPRMVNTVKAIDALLKVDLPTGPSWRRYNLDGYGEHEDGRPFDGTGVGRAWPLLAGERAHYEIAAGHLAEAALLLKSVEASVSAGGMIPEQVWDTDDVPARELFRGKPTGSAMPLVWAHSEHIKLLRSLADKKVFDMPPQTVQRYLVDKVRSNAKLWRFNSKSTKLPSGKDLRLELNEPTMLRWSTDEWAKVHDTDTVDGGLGLHVITLPVAALTAGAVVVFTMFRKASQSWIDIDYRLVVA